AQALSLVPTGVSFEASRRFWVGVAVDIGPRAELRHLGAAANLSLHRQADYPPVAALPPPCRAGGSARFGFGTCAPVRGTVVRDAYTRLSWSPPHFPVRWLDEQRRVLTFGSTAPHVPRPKCDRRGGSELADP